MSSLRLMSYLEIIWHVYRYLFETIYVANIFLIKITFN